MILLLLAFVLGMCIGFIVQRSKICFSIAVTELFLMKKFSSLKPFLVFIVTCMIGFHILNFLGVISLNLLSKPIGVYGIYALIGGMLFGFGMIIAGGCSIGVFYRVGEGKLKSLSALIGLFLGVIIYAFLYPYLKPILIQDISIILLPKFFYVSEWILIFVITLITIYWITKSGEKFEKTIIAGFLIGVLNIISTLTLGNSYYIGNVQLFLDPIAKIFNPEFETTMSLRDMITFMMMLPLGVIVGSFVSSLRSKEFKITKQRLKEGFIGGLFLGLGASIGLNCSYGHFVGISTFSITGILGFIGILLGGFLGIKIVERRIIQ
ncbi:MAG: YeeE/YedE family protein [Candidatus Altiarchaeota archaeon]